jgi:transmembrane sensor
MTSEQYILLYEKHLSGLCNPEEEALLMQYQDSFKIQDDHEVKLSDTDKKIRSDIYHRILRSISGNKKIFSLSWWWAAAAIVLLAVGLGTVFLNNTPEQVIVANKSVPVKSNVIKPGTTTAVLTLANGTHITLDDAANGVVAKAGNTSIKKLKNGLLSYADNRADASTAANSLNTITIPRGGLYTVVLPDGTHVWLNSETSLTYPVAFNGAERGVTLKGEAYFEVTKNKQKPFIVHSGNVNVRVLGTHFNVKAYQDDNVIKTTLLEGSVQLSNQASSALLVPGEQGIADADQDHITRKKVNVNQVVAWKSGYFIFREERIQDIMEQISRWYDVEVEYHGNISNKTFGGIYTKNKDINELLKALELTGLVHFKIEGRRIIVMT